jgi:hypothetical protein
VEFAQFHRAWWNQDLGVGIGKVHYSEVGVLAFLFEGCLPVENVDFLNKNEILYYQQQYKKQGKPLTIGVQINRDVELVKVVSEREEYFLFPELNLEVNMELLQPEFRSKGGSWRKIHAPVVQYQEIKSLVGV